MELEPTSRSTSEGDLLSRCSGKIVKYSKQEENVVAAHAGDLLGGEAWRCVLGLRSQSGEKIRAHIDPGAADAVGPMK